MFETIDPRWAWEPYRPTPQNPWDLKKVGHLYRRAAWGTTNAELEAGVRAGPERLVEQILAGGPGQDEFEAETRSLIASISRVNNPLQARGWWLYRLLYSPHPFKEKLTLFWHNHFATSNAKVNNAGYMLGQYDLMHRFALGNFRGLLQEMSKDPAMLVWLDANKNRKGMPNENYARELMELFSLGIGAYTEMDVREAARAFTGWEIVAGKAQFKPAQHDDGEKKVLGQKGSWNGADIVRICLEQKAAPVFLVGKLFRFLVADAAPPPALLVPLAEQLRRSDYDVGGLVAIMLRSQLFFAPPIYRAQVKSPIDFVLGIVHALEGHTGTTALIGALEDLGQNIFYPPSVKGWDGGGAWLNGQTLLARQNLALALTSTEDARFGRRTDPAALARKVGAGSDERQVDLFLRLFLQGDVPKETRMPLVRYLQEGAGKQTPSYWTAQDAADQRVRALCHLVLTLPEFQLN